MAHCPSTGSSPNAQSTTSHETIDTWIYARPKKMLIEHKLACLRADGYAIKPHRIRTTPSGMGNSRINKPSTTCAQPQTVRSQATRKAT
mgnify:CR=1 FL=1